MAKTPLAIEKDTFPLDRAPTIPPRHAQRTRVAAGGVVPPASSQPHTQAEAASAPESAIPRPRDRFGTRVQNAALTDAGGESPRIRLTSGRVVPGTRYRILRWLGEGGMGVVYEAEHIDIERRVALKILRFDLSRNPHMVKVFRDEARAASRLGSQYIVEIFDFGELPDGRLFFAMEMLHGGDLVPADSQQTLSPARLIAILRQVCKGLAGAHAAGVVHRDVKPENLIITTAAGRRDRVKIVDFGISAMLAVGQTGEQVIAGTPHYMAPEQILGRPFDGRLDVYALGCTAYELLTGVPPFDAEEVSALLQKQLDAAPTPPSQRRPELNLPEALDRVLLQCLAKSPRDRYANMAELEAALCEAQIELKLRTEWDDLPVPELADRERAARLQARMPSPVGEIKRRRWLWPTVAATSTAAALALGLFLARREPSEQPQEPDRSELDTIAAGALDAAAKANWVVPPWREPEAATAYRKVLELEALEGDAAEAADTRAGELRNEFAATLTRQAENLDEQQASLAAANHYLWSLAFDPNNEIAWKRAGIDTVMFARFLEHAKTGAFSDDERFLAFAAGTQAVSDPDVKAEREAELEEAVAGNSVSTNAQVAVMTNLPARARAERLRRSERSASAEPPVASAIAPLSATTPPAPGLAESDAKASKKKKNLGQDPRALLGNASRDPAAAKALAEQGLAALRAGRRSDATTLFHQSIGHDHTNATALMGLSDIYFDTGNDQKAVVFAEKAVAASPANHGFRIKLGDAYYKVLRYKDALAQYEQAKKQGSSKADDRIARARTKLGG